MLATDGLPGGTALSNGTWYHIAATYSNEEYQLRTYVDGRLDRSAEITCSLACFPATLCLGGRGTKGSSLSGWMDEVCLFNGPLGDAEIRALASWPAPN